jgi:sec-independent protein translocase protein TatA
MEGLLQPVHLILILVIVVILLGPGRLPDLGKGLGRGISDFR